MRHRARIGLYVLVVVVLVAGLVLSAPSYFPAPVGHRAELAAPAAPVRLVGPQDSGSDRPSSPEGVTGSVTATVDLTPTPSGKPPQFVVLSFDGGGSVDLWQYWRAVAARDHAHFTFFMSGPYLLTHATAADYAPPRHRAGASDIGTLPIPAGNNPTRYLGELLGQMKAGYIEGQEVGTHFGGHFCAPGAGNVGTWNAGDWSTELDQVSSLLTNVNENNQIDPPVVLPFGAGDVVGDRTPCLEGNLKTLYPVLAQHGFRYDASQSALEGLWPVRQEGIWSFPLASIPLAGRAIHVLSMDYNLYYNQTRARDVPAALEPSIEDQAYNTFMNYFAGAYTSNRAPVIIGAHFTHWNNSAYVRAVTRVMDDTCSQPEVRCVSFRDLADWLDAQSPAQLAALHALPVAHLPQGASLGSPQYVSPTAVPSEPSPPPPDPTSIAPSEPTPPASPDPTPLVQGPVEQ